MPPAPAFRVVRSPIHGLGVVAARAFAADEIITPIDGILCRLGERPNDDHLLWLDDVYYLDLVDQLRWLNHSCEPNLWIDGALDPATGQPWAHAIALRPIAPGDELTLDYAYAANVAVPCSCGAPQCRGWIVDPDDLPLLTSRA